MRQDLGLVAAVDGGAGGAAARGVSTGGIAPGGGPPVVVLVPDPPVPVLVPVPEPPVPEVQFRSEDEVPLALPMPWAPPLRSPSCFFSWPGGRWPLRPGAELLAPWFESRSSEPGLVVVWAFAASPKRMAASGEMMR